MKWLRVRCSGNSLAVVAACATLLPAPAAAQANLSCQVYADFALQQFRTKGLLNCDGGAADLWSGDYNYHVDWCDSRSTKPDLTMKAIADRAQVLSKCESVNTAQQNAPPAPRSAPVQQGAPPAAPATAAASACKPIVGAWSWFVSDSITFNADGTQTQGRRRGRWNCRPAGFYFVTWDNEGAAEILTVSPDGRRLSSSNGSSGERRVGTASGGLGTSHQAPAPPASELTQEAGQLERTARASIKASFGIDVAALNDELRGRYRIKATVKGVVVTGVDMGSPAADKRFETGNVIVEIAQEAVASADDFQSKVDKLKKNGRRTALLLVSGADGELRFVALPLPPPAVQQADQKPLIPGDPQLDELFRDFFSRRGAGAGVPGGPTASAPPQTAQASPQAAQPSPREQDGGWSRREVAIALKPLQGNPSRGVLGIRIAASDPILGALRPGRKGGVLVVNVSQDGAALGVLQRGDIIAAAAGLPMNAAADLATLAGNLSPGTPLKLEYWRYAEGFPQLQAALFARAQANDPAATYVLGYFEQSPPSGEPNHVRAFGFHHRAAALGHLQAMEATGLAYRDGVGTEKNPSEAGKWYRRAAEAGSTIGMYNIGLLIADGKLGAPDPPEAFRWMQRAAAGGHATAGYQLARYYDFGYGTAQDREAGARHLVEAVRTGTADVVSYISSANATWKPSADFISALQRNLTEAKAYNGPVDGILSPDVTAALTQLQRGMAR